MSSDNYAAATRPAYAALLPWTLRLSYPPRARATAKARSEHLGLSALDVDAESEETANEAQTPSVVPPSLLKRPKESVSRLLGRPEHAKLLRLEAVTRDFLEPLADLLGHNDYLLAGPGPSSLDCLAFGYLALALLPELPHPWLARTMRSDFAGLCEYVERGQEELLGGPVEEGGLTRSDGKREQAGLPWIAAKPWEWSDVVRSVLSDVARAVPGAAAVEDKTRIRTSVGTEVDVSPSHSIGPHGPPKGSIPALPMALAVGAASAAACAVYVVSAVTSTPTASAGASRPGHGESDKDLVALADRLDFDLTTQMQRATEADLIEELDVRENSARLA